MTDQLINICQPGVSRLYLLSILPSAPRLSTLRNPPHRPLDPKERCYETSRMDAHGTRVLRDRV